MKILFLLIFLYSHFAACHYCGWHWKMTTKTILYPKCDVEKDFQKIYYGTTCSNLVAVDGNSFALTKVYFELINDTFIKKWEITNDSKKFVQFSVNNETICQIVLTLSSYDKIDFIFANNDGLYYATWDHYKQKAVETFLTEDLTSLVGITNDYVFLFNFENNTLKESLFSKTEKKFTEFYDLRKYNQSIAVIRPSFSLFPKLYEKKSVVVVLADGSTETVYPKYPSLKRYIYQSNSDSYGGSSSESSSSSSSTIIWIPVGLIFVVLKCCACYYCKLGQRGSEDGGLERTSAFRPECRSPPSTTTQNIPHPSYPQGIPQNEFENLLNSRNWNEPIPMAWKPQN